MSVAVEEYSPTEEEVYQTLLRSLRRRKGFGIVFIQCSSAQANWLIPSLQADLADKKVGVLQLTEPIDNFYNLIADRPDRDQLNILLIQGLEKSLEADIKPGYGGDADYYNLNTVPRILAHLNQQRENFRDHFGNICFVFVLPLFAIKYFIRRAPDFFDWQSGIFEFPMDAEQLQRESWQAYFNSSKQENYRKLSYQERRAKILDLQSLIDEDHQSTERKADLFFEQALLFQLNQEYEKAIAFYNQALAIKPGNYQAWNNRGVALNELGQDEEAIVSYDRALTIKPDYQLVWINRGIVLSKLGRYEEAIASHNHGLAIKLGDHEAWINRGFALDKLGRYEEAIASYDKAIELQPNYDVSYYNKACCYALQGKVEEACKFLDQAIALNPKNREIATTDSAFDEIREDERWRSLIEE